MSEDPIEARPDPIARLTRTVTAVGGMVAAVVAISTTVTQCALERETRHAAFRTAVAAEETYWKALFEDYLSTFGEPFISSAEAREAKLYGIQSLANHQVPAFEEFSVGAGLKLQAKTRLEGLQTSLIDALQNKKASGEAVAEASSVAMYTQDAGQVLRDRSAPAATLAPAATAETPSTSLSYQTQILSVGQSTGWDVDVIWCQGEGEAARAAEATFGARALAQRADAGEPLASGVRLGRIRLRSIPVTSQSQEPAAGRGNVVVFDRGEGERAAADAVAGVLNRGAAFEVLNSPGRTRWYLSAFVCAPRPAAGEGTGAQEAR